MTRSLATWGVVMLGLGCGGRPSAPREPEQFSLTVRSEGRGGGHVRSTPLGLDCELRPSGEDDAPSCVLKVPEGSQLMLTASANDTSYFKGWADTCGGRGYCLVTVKQSLVVGVNFERTGGEVRWPLSFGGKSTNVSWAAATTPNNDVVLVGSFEGTTAFGPTQLISNGGSDIFIAKLDRYSNVIWATSLGGPWDDRATSVAVSKTGTIIVTGSVQDKVMMGGTTLVSGGGGGFVAALTEEARKPKVLWAEHLGGAGRSIVNAVQTYEDDAYVIGSYSGNLNLGHNFTSQGADDVFVLRYRDVSQNEPHHVWGKTLGGSGAEIGGGLAVDAAGDVVVTGGYSKTALFCEGTAVRRAPPPPPPHPGPPAGRGRRGKAPPDPPKPPPPSLPPPGPPAPAQADGCRDVGLTSHQDSTDAFVARLAQKDGSLAWARGLGGIGRDVGYSVAVSKDHVYAFGSFEHAADLGGASPIDAGDDTGIYLVYLADATGVPTMAERIGHGGPEVYLASAVDPSGAVLVAGSFDGMVNKGEDAGGPHDGSILKLHVSADKPELEWSRRIKPDGDTARVYALGLAADHTGSVFVSGAFSGALKLSDGRTGHAGAAVDIYVARLGTGGQPEWLGGSDDRGEDAGRAVAVDASGAIAVVGSFTDNMSLGSRLESSGRTDVFVTKLRPGSSAVAWSACIGSRGSDLGYAVAMGPLPEDDAKRPDNEKKGGQIAVAGSYSDTVTFAGAYQVKRFSKATEPNRGGNDGFVAWYSGDGQLLDRLSFGGSGDDVASAVAIDDDNQTYVSGWFQGKISIGNQELESQDGSIDGFLAKLDDKHKVVWAYRMGGPRTDKVRAIALDRARRHVVVTGVYRGKLDLQDQGHPAKLSLAGTADKTKDLSRGFVAEYDAAGALLWAQSYADDAEDVTGAALAVNQLDRETNELGLSTKVDRGAVAVGWQVGADPDVRASPSSWVGHGVILRYSSAGVPEQRRPQRPIPDMCRDRVRALALEGNTLVATGAFSSRSYKIGHREYCSGSASDLYVVKYDHRKPVASKIFSSDGGANDAGGLVRQTRQLSDETTGKHQRIDETVLTGNFQGVLKLDDREHGATLRSTDSADVFVLDLDL